MAKGRQVIFTAELSVDLNGLQNVTSQGKTVDEGWDVDDLGYFVLLCKSSAWLFLPIIYDIYCGGGESFLSYTETETYRYLFSAI